MFTYYHIEIILSILISYIVIILYIWYNMYGDNMYIKDLHLLQVNIQKDDNKVFEGIIEDAPEELREVEIKKMYLDGKILIVNIEKTNL